MISRDNGNGTGAPSFIAGAVVSYSRHLPLLLHMSWSPLPYALVNIDSCLENETTKPKVFYWLLESLLRVLKNKI